MPVVKGTWRDPHGGDWAVVGPVTAILGTRYAYDKWAITIHRGITFTKYYHVSNIRLRKLLDKLGMEYGKPYRVTWSEYPIASWYPYR